MATAKQNEDDLGGQYARGEIDLTELNFRAATAGREATVGEESTPKSTDDKSK